jgi:hypothetical protein
MKTTKMELALALKQLTTILPILEKLLIPVIYIKRYLHMEGAKLVRINIFIGQRMELDALDALILLRLM